MFRRDHYPETTNAQYYNIIIVVQSRSLKTLLNILFINIIKTSKAVLLNYIC